jgi:3-dehydroquinate dehydratase type I
MKICRDLLEKNKYKNVISFCMGELGIFSRIMCVIAGSFLTYASLEERTAPGQINIKNMRDFLQILSDNY